MYSRYIDKWETVGGSSLDSECDVHDHRLGYRNENVDGFLELELRFVARRL